VWTYHSDTGILEHNGAEVGQGYSGHAPNGKGNAPDGINNPALESDPDVGPIPRGAYSIGEFFNDPEKGPIVACLSPASETNTFGRSGFMLHGDNIEDNESASLGCIIMPHDVRAQVEASGDTDLQVV
jgi:Protein of unknown function (DUF2778)